MSDLDKFNYECEGQISLFENEESTMDKITTEMAEHICDKLCKYPCMKFEGDECLEDICAECKMGQFICDILNQYNCINDFEQTQSYKLLEKIAELEARLPQFEIGDTAYLVDYEAKVIDSSVVNGYVRRTDNGGTEYEYDSDLLEFHSDDVGVIAFKSYGEALKALERRELQDGKA